MSEYAFQTPSWNRLLSASQLRLWHPSYGGRRREDTNRGCSAVERFYSDKLDGPPLFMFMEAIFLCVMVQKPKIVGKEWELYLQYKHGQTFWTNMWDITRLTYLAIRLFSKILRKKMPDYRYTMLKSWLILELIC